MLHGGVRTREDQALMAVLRPPDEVRRSAVGATDLEDLGVLDGLAHMLAPHHQPVSDVCTHRTHSHLTSG